MSAPEKIYNWLDSHLSPAQYSGGCTFNCRDYYIDYTDLNMPLVRVDILKAEAKAKKEAAKTAKRGQAARQKQAQAALPGVDYFEGVK